MEQSELVIQDFKNQIGRLSEERAIYFALATDNKQSFDTLNKNFEALTQENQQLKAEIDQLKSAKKEDDVE